MSQQLEAMRRIAQEVAKRRVPPEFRENFDRAGADMEKVALEKGLYDLSALPARVRDPFTSAVAIAAMANMSITGDTKSALVVATSMFFMALVICSVYEEERLA